jgi:hypothetical protein
MFAINLYRDADGRLEQTYALYDTREQAEYALHHSIPAPPARIAANYTFRVEWVHTRSVEEWRAMFREINRTCHAEAFRLMSPSMTDYYAEQIHHVLEAEGETGIPELYCCDTIARAICTDAEPNARFWVWYKSGWVKLTLTRKRPTVSLVECGATEEGGFYFTETFTLEGSVVYNEWYRDERDCDGRIERSGEVQCPTYQLNCIDPCDEDFAREGHKLPAWDKLRREQRDHSAEAAGY